MPRSVNQEGKKICMFVLNPCTTDARVLKEAETLARAGHHVDIIAIVSPDVPDFVEKRPLFTIYRVQPRSVKFHLDSVWFSIKKGGRACKNTVKVIFRFLLKTDLSRLSARKDVKEYPPGSAISRPSLFAHIRSLGQTVKISVRDFIYKNYRLTMYMSYWLRAKKVAEGLKADIYHAHDLNALVPAYWAARKTGGKVVYDSHELFTEIHTFYKFEVNLFRWIEKHIIRKVDLVITVNGSIADELSRRYGIRRPQVIINCPPPLNGKKDMALSDLLRIAAGLPADKKLVLYQGGYSSHRGLEELIGAFKYLDDGYALVFMGWGKLQGELEALVTAGGLDYKIKFLPPVAQDVLLSYTSSADVGLIPYKPESLNNYYTLPNKLFEYINANVPVAASDLPELRNIINGFEIGRLFDPEDPKSIAEAIRSILSDEEGYRAMKVNTARAASRFNWDVESLKFLECYSSL